MAATDYDTKDQMEKIAVLVNPGETLLTVYYMKGDDTGSIGITDLRLIFLDEAFILITPRAAVAQALYPERTNPRPR